MRVYVAGPYTASTPEDVEANVRRACEVGAQLIALGHTPFVPHLSHYIEAVQAFSYEMWMAQDMEWLRLCDAVLYFMASPGAAREANAAHAMGIPVYATLDNFKAGKPIHQLMKIFIPPADVREGVVTHDGS